MKTLIFVAAIALVGLRPASAQEARSPRQLFEAGLYGEALQAIAGQRDQGTAGAPADYLAAQAFLKLEQPDNAKAELSRLIEQPDPVWKLVGESGRALIDRDVKQALDAAAQAIAMNPEHFFAQYQLGLVNARWEDWPGAAAAFERASQIDPTFAYAHYYAGLSYSRVRRADRTAAHFETFLKLAPKAPERAAVESIMRTLRGR